MKKITNPPRNTWSDLCKRPSVEREFLSSTVRNILNQVKIAGDDALKDFTLRYDHVRLESLKTTSEEIGAAQKLVSRELKQAIRIAQNNIKTFHAAQRKKDWTVDTMPGVKCWQKSVPIEKIGIYIPGGSAPLFSTLLMLGVPAKLAGCKNIILCTPPRSDGSVNPAILYTANEIGITEIFKVGGAQAIAAMAFGTTTIPSVYKIFGPGNQYVTAAKQLVALEGVAIDLPAGPSEVLVVGDENSDPRFIAADLLSQAEHGRDSQVVLLTNSSTLLELVHQQLEMQITNLPRKEIAREALKNSLSIQFTRQDDVVDFINEYAPEHLIVNIDNHEKLSDRIVNAGSVFLGAYSPESAGDYASGTNHTLPTNGFAKAYSGVSLESFQKTISYQQLTREGLKNIGEAVETMAEAEQLEAHKNAITIRLADQ